MRDELTLLLDAVREAGKAILLLQENGFTVELKANNELLTQADLKANAILNKHLMVNFPQTGWLSEESADNAARLAFSKVFIVDPIDGTIEYARNIPEYAISVALAENGQVILAAVFNPATDQLFYAAKGQGAWLNDNKITCCATAPESLTFLASRSEDKRGEWDRFKENHHVKIVGSIAYKLALVAAGMADATFSLGPKNEWDIAAGVLLVLEAGGVVTTQHGKEFIFNQKNTLVDGIVATSAVINTRVMNLIR